MQPRTLRLLLPLTLLALLTVSLGSDTAAQDQPPTVQELSDDERKMLEYLTEQSQRLLGTVDDLRAQLADARLEAMLAKRELEEARQFMAEHPQLGRDFQDYQGIKAIAEREAKQRQLREAREAYERQRAEERSEAGMMRMQREASAAEQQRVRDFKKAGFNPLGLDVFVSQTSFFYDSSDEGAGVPWRFDYSPFIGHYARYYPYRGGGAGALDFSKMTISGSVLNASDEVRNIGVAFTFFDENGTQVGQEIIQVNNARRDVPYPFTSMLDMALNRPFDSASVYVLYADAVGAGEGEGEE